MEMLFFQDSPSDHSLLNFSSFQFDNEEYAADGWTLEENKLFENVMAEFDPAGSLAFFEHVALLMPWKSIETIKLHYQALVEDIETIKSDLFETPMDDHEESVKNGKGSSSSSQATRSNLNQEKRKATPWTAQEHKWLQFLEQIIKRGQLRITRYLSINGLNKQTLTDIDKATHTRRSLFMKLFLMGLEKFGKGDWRSIARYFVTSKTPTQVASHAQKFFSRKTSTTPADKRRPSINDIQTISSTFSSYPQRHRNPPQQPNTAQNNRVSVPNNFLPNDHQVADPFPNPMYNITSNNNNTTTANNYNYNVHGQVGSAVYPLVNSTFQVDDNGNPMISQAWMNQQFWNYFK